MAGLHVVRCSAGSLGEIILKGEGGGRERCVAGGQGKLEQLLINMRALSFSPFSPSVEEEEEDEEMAEVKPGLESEQQDEDDSREAKEGRMLPHLPSAPSSSSSLGFFHAVGQTPSLVCVTTCSMQPYQMEGLWGGAAVVSAIGHVGVSAD